MGKLDGKVALISGAARSLGAALVCRFVEEGARVVMGDILDQDGKQLEQELRSRNGDVHFLHLDVTNEASWKAAIQETIASYGRLDILVNNAAVVISVQSIDEISVDDWDRVMEVNARGVFLGTKHSIPAMRASGGGSIVNISSIAGIGQCQIMEPCYAASKGAVRIFSKVTAAQHAKDRIRCNSVHPGPINTGMLKQIYTNKELLDKRLSRVPLGRLAEVEEIVAGVMYLASDDSAYTTGTELVIDGGSLVQ